MMSTQTDKYIWICEECGREFDKLPFPSSCACGNYCEDFFRLKDRFDCEDDLAGRPLLGVKYGEGVLEEREERLKTGVQNTVVNTPSDNSSKPIIDFKSMNKKQLRGYLEIKGSPLAKKTLKQEELVKACERVELVEELW